MTHDVVLGLDVGGSHVACICASPRQQNTPHQAEASGSSGIYGRHSVPVRDCHNSLVEALRAAVAGALAEARKSLIGTGNDVNGQNDGDPVMQIVVERVGVGLPGPFDARLGLGCQTHKWDGELFGVDVRQCVRDAVRDSFNSPSTPSSALAPPPPPPTVTLENDASCFALGCKQLILPKVGLAGRAFLALTLGTGLGSCIVDGAGLVVEKSVGALWGLTVSLKSTGAEGLADDHFSGRALAQLDASEGSDSAAFARFGEDLAAFLLSQLRPGEVEAVVVGGGAGVGLFSKFAPAMEAALGIRVVGSSLGGAEIASMDELACSGAITAATSASSVPSDVSVPLPLEHRVCVDDVAPAQKLRPADGASTYHLFPSHDVLPAGSVNTGSAELGQYLLRALKADSRVFFLDGYAGVFFHSLCNQLSIALRPRRVRFLSVEAALRDDLEEFVSPFLGGNDPLWGTAFTGTLRDFFDPERLGHLQKAMERGADDLVCVFGAGASVLLEPGAKSSPILYADLPKNELQFRMRANFARNIGVSTPLPPKAAYKRSYFVDWPAQNAHKRELVSGSRLAAVIDDQQSPAQLVWVTGETLEQGLRDVASCVFRPRPWFEPGVWGGQILKEMVPLLNKDAPNYAWSFELIAPENGVTLSDGHRCLEVSLDWLMFLAARDILGSHGHTLFGDEFPIRFDFLDTVAGGNLSVQCHPSGDYIREHFGERFTQDESYYIFDCEEGTNPHVYLGFTDDARPQEFAADLRRAAADGVEIDIERHVNKWPSKKGDLFLIPNCTVHASGSGNLVLEISATPYIFTNKLYDWNRLGMDGQPRPINVDRGMDNLDFHRRTEYTRTKLLAHSNVKVVSRGEGWRVVHLPTTEHVFYDVHRIEFEQAGTTAVTKTDDSVRVLNVVVGGPVEVQIAGHTPARLCRGETWIVPASVGEFVVVPAAAGDQVLDVFLKADAKLS